MVEPVGFIEAWKAQFPESEPPKMELRSVGGIEQELEKCKASIRRLEQEVNKERFRMIYLQTLLAKERKSYDRQRWGFRKTPLNEGVDPATVQGADCQSQQPHMQESSGCVGGGGERSRFQLVGEASRSKPRPPPARKSASHGDGLELQSAFEVPQQAESTSCDNLDGLSPSKQRGGISISPRRPSQPPPDKELPCDPKDKVGMGLGVAALRSNFERIKRANSHSAGDVAKGQEKQQQPPPPFYTNMEFHHERGLVRVNDREVSDKISSLGSQAMQMERKRSLHSLPGNLATVAGELRARPVYRGRSTESTCGYDAEYEDGDPNQRHPARANGGKPPPPPWQPSDFQAYSSVYIGGVMMGEGGGGEGRGSGVGGSGGVTMRDHGGGDDHLLTWPRRSYSPGSFEDVGGGGGYTPDCSSNENLTSSEEDFSSGQSSHVSPSPTTAFRRPFREKSRSPSQNSQNSQHSFDSSSPPTPQSQKRHHRQQGGHVVMSEATIVSVRKTGQIWPPASHHDPTSHGRASHDNSFHGDHLDGHFTGTPPTYGYDADRAEEQRRHHDILPYIDDSPSSSPHLSSKSRSSRDTLSSGSLESSKSCAPTLHLTCTLSLDVITLLHSMMPDGDIQLYLLIADSPYVAVYNHLKPHKDIFKKSLLSGPMPIQRMGLRLQWYKNKKGRDKDLEGAFSEHSRYVGPRVCLHA
ncbi:breakpoint cluster region protein-like [Lampris incognitus]|uniref:breakpoint cluster region protein-like n=1 Tax=Lampris incognitus TaxID=2546036 RepID=UPI0024B5D1AA|nr:breakpoint cluster region protein-like [Lampris incognitus]